MRGRRPRNGCYCTKAVSIRNPRENGTTMHLNCGNYINLYGLKLHYIHKHTHMQTHTYANILKTKEIWIRCTGSVDITFLDCDTVLSLCKILPLRETA